MAGDAAAAGLASAGCGPLARELGRWRAARRLGAAGRRAEGFAPRGRRGGRRGARALDAGARRRDGGVADRPLRRRPRAARARALGGGPARRRAAPRSQTTSRATLPTRLASIAAARRAGYAAAVGSVVASFETREAYLEDVPVADTALVLDLLARRRGIDVAAAGLADAPALVGLALLERRVEGDRDRLQRLARRPRARSARSISSFRSVRSVSVSSFACTWALRNSPSEACRSKPRCSSRSCAACSSLASPAARISGPTLRCFATGQ